MTHPTPNPKKFKDIKAVIFDWSGVISDDRRPVHAADGIVLKKYGIENYNFERWLEDTKASAPEYFAYRGLQGDPLSLAQEYEEALHVARNEGIHPELYPHARETIETLSRTYELFVVSKHPTVHLHAEAKEYGIDSFFNEILGDLPDKTFAIQNILAAKSFPPDQVAYVGDMTYDVEAGRNAGVVTVGIPTGYQTREQLVVSSPDILIHSLSELTHFL